MTQDIEANSTAAHPLKGWLKRERMTLAAFGRLCLVTETSVSRWINGQRVPRPQMMMKIEKITRGAVRPADWFAAMPGEERAA